MITCSTYLLYGPAVTAAAPLVSLLTFLTGTECYTIRGWHFPRRYTQTHTHTRWMPSWPVRDQHTAASSPSSQHGDTRKSSCYGFQNKTQMLPSIQIFRHKSAYLKMKSAFMKFYYSFYKQSHIDLCYIHLPHHALSIN